MMWRNLAIPACLLVLLGGLTVPVMSAETYNLNCYLASDDQDNDGYAAGSAKQTLQLPREERLTCPPGYVPGKNDDRDNDASVHPRKAEKQFNAKDDNCNGLVDEPQISYDPYPNEITTSSFNIRLKINDQDTVDNRNDLYANIEYAKLSDPWTRYHTGKKQVTLTVSDTGRYYCTLTLDGLSETTVYMARVQFYVKKQSATATQPVTVFVDPRTNREVVQTEPAVMRREPELESRGQVIFPYPDRDSEATPDAKPAPSTSRRTPPKRGSTATATAAAPAPTTTTTRPAVRRTSADQPEVAPWRGDLTSPWRRITRPGTRILYEAVGSPSDWYFDTTDGTKEKSKVRTKMVHKAVLQFYDSEDGKIGILGYQRINGSRYCGNDYDWWCSEIYCYCAEDWLDGISGLGKVSEMVDYFSGSYYPESWVENADRGDYVSFGDYHTGMFLALAKNGSNNPDDWYIWTLEGNTSDSRRFDEAGTYVKHVPGNTAQVLYTKLTEAEFGFGHILYDHLK